MKRVTALFTALMLLVCLFAGCQSVGASTVVLEANSSVQLNLSGKTVKETDAALDGKKLDEAIAAVIGNMIQNGELTEEANTVLISVSDAELQQSAQDAAAKAFEAQGFAGAVICQSAQGKAALVESMAAAFDKYSADALAELSITELKLLCEANDATLEGVTFAGAASVTALVGEDIALDVALAQADVAADAATDVEVVLDFSDYLFYDVKFTADGTALEAYIEAATGELLYSGVVGGDRTDDDEEEKVTEETAIAAACLSVGAEVSAVKDVECKYMDASAQIFYDVSFTYKDARYNVLISAATGLPLEGDVPVDETISSGDEDVAMPTEDNTVSQEAIDEDILIEEPIGNEDLGG